MKNNELKKIVEGKSKVIYQLENTEKYIMYYKPHLRSITSKREENISGTDYWRILATVYFMNLLKKNKIKTHLISNSVLKINGLYAILVKKAKAIPIEWICRYYAAGSIVRLYPSLVKVGQKFDTPLYKFDLKQDLSVAGVDDPTLNENYITGLGLLTNKQFKDARKLLEKVGRIINDDLNQKGIQLIDMKMEFGFDSKGRIMVIDEISQDCIRANDKITDRSITKDVFRELKTDTEVLNAYRYFMLKLDKNAESNIKEVKL